MFPEAYRFTHAEGKLHPKQEPEVSRPGRKWAEFIAIMTHN